MNQAVGAVEMPPTIATSCTIMSDPLTLAYTPVAATPRITPPTPPMAASTSASPKNWPAMWRLVAPRDRRRPISPRRSITEMTMTLAKPTPPTSNTTALTRERGP